MNYTLNITRLRELSKKAGFGNIGDLCQAAKIHRNSITPYIKQERSPFTQVILDLAKALKVPALELVTVRQEENLTQVIQRLTKILTPNLPVFIFGSRARGDHQKFSDLDIGITAGKNRISFSKFSSLKSKIEDAFEDFPISINLINLDIAPLDFLIEIEADLKLIFGNEAVANFFLGYLNGRKAN